MCSADGTVLAIEREGAGPPLVLVVGALCDRQAFGVVAARLAASATVLRYDRRGRGASGDTPPYAVDREVEDLAAVLAAAGGPATVVGHSSGAALALRAAGQGVRMERLVAYEPPFSVAPVPDDGLATAIGEDLDAGRPADAVRRFLGAAGAAVEPWPEAVAVAHTLPYDLQVAGELPRDVLAAITAPTLVAVGAASAPFFRETADALVALIPGAHLAVLPGQDHNPADDVFVELIGGHAAADHGRSG